MNEGKKDRRDPIRTIKARNPVAKNASAAIGGGAAGAHKDKKKAAKQGEVKHKKAEYAEGLQNMLETALRDKEDLQAKRKTLQDLSMNKDVDQKAVTQRKLDLEKEAKKKGMSESSPQYNKFRVGQKVTYKGISSIVTDVDYDDDAVKIRSLGKPYPNTGEMETEVDPGWKFLTPDRHYNPDSLVKATSRESQVGEEFDSPEYNDEAGMAESNLHTLARAVNGLMDTIDDDDNLPEWCQEKIAKAEMMLVSVWDYLLSQKEQGIDPDVTEGLRNPKDNPCWKGYKPVGTKKKAGKTVPNCVPKESWTHDSLASRLFETENTYEDRLSNMLNKKLGK